LSALKTQKNRPRRCGIRLLIVDDHPVMRRGLSQVVSEMGNLEVCGEAASKDEAMEMIGNTRPDVVIVDISLGEENGLDLIKEINARFSTIKILVHSMHDETIFAERVLRAGALGYIGKNETTQELIEAIHRVVNGEVHLSPRMTRRVLRRKVGQSAPALEESPVTTLTDRELQVFDLIGRGVNTKQIAARLALSVKTVESHRENIKTKLGLANAIELTREAVQWVLEC
jgi:DNA-binding NarL/FixJ family response regulator